MRLYSAFFSRALLSCAMAALAGSSTAGRATAANLQVVGGELVGASNVLIDGLVYDVAFVDGSCNSLFGAPDCQFIDFPFDSLPKAQLATQALLGQVFIDGPAGNFDSSPSLTAGCSSATVCAAATAFSGDPPSNILEVSAVNVANVGGDLVQNFSVSQTLDTTAIVDAVYVAWTLTAPASGPVLNEISVNPPGSDAPFEYVEIRGDAGGALTNVYAVAFEGDGAVAGITDWVVDLSAAPLGSNGILVMKSAAGHFAPPETTVVLDAQFDTVGLENGTNTLMLIRTTTGLVENFDYDSNNDGTLELPLDARILDSVGWRDGDDPNDRVYGPTTLPTPPLVNAATRLANAPTPYLRSAWFYGRLAGVQNDSILYDPLVLTPNAPINAALTPGAPNPGAPAVPSLAVGTRAMLLLGLLGVAFVHARGERKRRLRTV